jgi:transketolase
MAWEARLEASDLRAEWDRFMDEDLSAAIEGLELPELPVGTSLATREAGGKAIQAISRALPQLLGGSADLAHSNLTYVKDGGDIRAGDFKGRNLHFGIREHAMAAICNGLSLHGGIVPFCATFMVFHDYMRPAVRLSAFMERRVVYVYTHDSIFVGEDGPTHQPIEQLMALRGIPGLVTLRPADANETFEAWRVALARQRGPTALALTRQALPVLDRASRNGELAKGAYVLREASGGVPRVVLMASGSEVALAMEARARLEARGYACRVVSFPSWELFDAQDAAYRESVLPPGIPRVSVEAGRTLGWERYTGLDGARVGIDTYGISAPAKQVAERLGLSVEAVVEAATGVLGLA